MSTVQDRSFNSDVAAAVGDVVRARGYANSPNYGGVNNASDANLVAQIAPVVLTSLRTLAQHGGQQGSGTQWQQSQPAYQTQQGIQAQQGQQQNQGQQQDQGRHSNGGYQQNQGQQSRPINGISGAPQLSSRGTLAAVVTPIVAEALARYQPLQNTAGGYSQARPLDRDWLESISSVVADVTPTVVDALKTFQPQAGAQNSSNAANLQAAAQRGAFDDLTSVVAATVPLVIEALRAYQPQQAQPSQRHGSDDVFDVARLAAPIAIAAL